MVGVLAALADLILPRSCVACHAPGTLLCDSCQPAGPLVHRGARGLPVLAAGEYADGLRAALVAYKERDRRDLAAPLAALLGRAVEGWLTHCPDAVLVPIPSAPSAARRRGGDHVLRLAHGAARPAAIPVLRALHTVRAVADSAGLGVDARATNLAFAFAAARPATPASALLVDDIVTTGTTLAEAARALTAAGWGLAGAAVVAATPRRGAATLVRFAASSHRSAAGTSVPTGLT